MTKIKFALIALLFVSVNINAQVIEKTYYFHNYKIAQADNYKTINFNNTLLTGKPGEPVLPYHRLTLHRRT